MWSKEERTRSYFETTLRKAADLGQMAMIIQDTGSGPDLNDVTNLLEARLRLRGAYDDMVKEAKRFVSTDTMFVERPHFYDELISLIHTTGDSVDEALSMSREYLCDISDIEGTFHTSAAICSQLSSQINRLANKIDLSSDEVKELEDMKERSRRIFQRMENRLAQITRRARTRKDTVTFPKLQDQVRTTRLALARTHVPSKHRAYLPTTTTSNKPTDDAGEDPKDATAKPKTYNCAGCNKKISPVPSGTVHVKAAITEISMGDRDTPQGKHRDAVNSEHTGRGGPRGPTSDDAPQQTQIKAGSTSMHRPFGTTLKYTNPISIAQRQRTTPNPTTRLTTNGDRLVPMRRIQRPSGTEEKVQYIPYRPYMPIADAIEYISQKTPQPETSKIPRWRKRAPLGHGPILDKLPQSIQHTAPSFNRN